jgi:hypothetical protein
VETQKKRTSNEYYVLAAVRIEETLLAARSKSELPAAEQTRQQQNLDKAMDDLRQAFAEGYEADEDLEQDAVLEPIRWRADFKKLLADTKKGSKQKK